jgi:hypothetical protein
MIAEPPTATGIIIVKLGLLAGGVIDETSLEVTKLTSKVLELELLIAAEVKVEESRVGEEATHCKKQGLATQAEQSIQFQPPLSQKQ